MFYSFLNKNQDDRSLRSTVKVVSSFLKVCLVVIALIEVVNGFNVAPEAIHIAKIGDHANLHRNAYFGYSVALLKKQSEIWLIVGAPRANSSFAGNNIVEPGTIFKCALANKELLACEEVVLDTTMNFKYRDLETNAKPLRNHAWTGAAMDIDRDGNVIIGAPRWSDTQYTNEYKTNGMCYVLGPNLASETAEKLPTLLLKSKQLFSYYGKGVYYYSHGEIGMAVHTTTSSKRQQLILGAPGVLNWQGSIAKLEPQATMAPGGISKRQATIQYETKIIPNPIYTSKIQDGNLFGYSVTSGKFDHEKEFHYVAGAPRGAASYGMALVFTMREVESVPMNIKEERNGLQLGEYFGAAVAAPDFNGDGLSDLVVGAPMHSYQGIGDAGCVYVYINSVHEIGKLAETGILLYGDQSKGARFGTTLGTPGDLNKDKFEDLLVGAPYEDGEDASKDHQQGAVYVFMGYQNGVRTKYAQKLTPKTVALKYPLKGFGISFSRSMDIDNNKYPDFAVGSYISDAVAIMKTRPVITVHGEISSKKPKLSLTDKFFTIEICVGYSGSSVPPSADITATVTLGQESGEGTIPATFNSGSTSQDVPFTNVLARDPKCHSINVGLNVERTNAQKPIIVRMECALSADDPQGPVLDPYATPPLPIVMQFVTGCDNEICHADLETKAQFSGFKLDQALLIGSESKITLEVEVSNQKDPAFLPNITLSIPSPLKIFPSIHMCTSSQGKNQRTNVMCQLTSPLNKNALEKLIFEFGVNSMDDRSSDIEIDIHANSAADFDDNPSNNNYTALLKVQRKAKLEFRGSSNPEQYSYELLDEKSIAYYNETVPFQHIVTISKFDVTPLGSVRIVADFPTDVIVKGVKLPLLENIDQHTLSFHSKTYYCEVHDSSGTANYTKNQGHLDSDLKIAELHCANKIFSCKSVLCEIGTWERNFDVATLTVSFGLNITTLGHLIDIREGVKIVTDVNAAITSLKNPDKYFEGKWKINGKVVTVLLPGALAAEPLEWWVYFLAILGGLILLALIAFVLYKLGFFKRKKKEEMQAQKATLLHQQETQRASTYATTT